LSEPQVTNAVLPYLEVSRNLPLDQKILKNAFNLLLSCSITE